MPRHAQIDPIFSPQTSSLSPAAMVARGSSLSVLPSLSRRHQVLTGHTFSRCSTTATTTAATGSIVRSCSLARLPDHAPAPPRLPGSSYWLPEPGPRPLARSPEPPARIGRRRAGGAWTPVKERAGRLATPPGKVQPGVGG